MNLSMQFASLDRQKFIHHLLIMGLALLGSAVIYLIAANWWMLNPVLQLAIPPSLLLLTAVASVLLPLQSWMRQALHTLCGLWIGLSLAVIGQVYQTGADSYLLFVLWGVLLMPWLYQPNTDAEQGGANIGVFALFSVVTQLALLLFFKQTFWLDLYPFAYIAALNLFSVLLFILCVRYFAALSYGLLIFFGVVATLSMIGFIDHGHGYYLVSALFLPVMGLFYFYRDRQPLATSLAALSLGISITVYLVHWMIEFDFDSAIGLSFSLAVLIFIWFACLSLMLKKLLPDTQFHVIPLAFGAWLAGLLLAAGVLISWQSVSMAFGLVFILLASITLKKAQHYFARQLAYCLMVCGQVALLWHSFQLTELWSVVLLIQCVILGLSFYLRTHWVFILLQMLSCYALTQAMIMDVYWHFDARHATEIMWSWTLLNLLSYSLLFAVGMLHKPQYRRTIMLFVLIICMGFAAFQQLLFSHQQYGGWGIQPWWLLVVLWIGVSYVLILSKQLTPISALLMSSFALIVSYLGYFEIYLLLLILAWALQQGERLVYGMSILCLIISLWMLYYRLDLSFMFKALSIFLSGMLLIGLAQIIKQQEKRKQLQWGDAS